MPPASTSRLRTAALITAVGAVGAGLAVRYQARALRNNELAQERSRAAGADAAHTAAANERQTPPNLYVSVDRSGGGI
ncbi:hypothetical protein SPI_04119 [Niveomyces insectorum RCEF 264]|uniref:Uncharacterized protein n=1 Tax=Niveomyces insectorum RCEF 264 TaxID=1081102 RepID=A0A167VG74_9HYPO|nr:hypothetical protein SPI_04119 [Niveomyces insectorum RCEF 264]